MKQSLVNSYMKIYVVLLYCDKILSNSMLYCSMWQFKFNYFKTNIKNSLYEETVLQKVSRLFNMHIFNIFFPLQVNKKKKKKKIK